MQRMNHDAIRLTTALLKWHRIDVQSTVEMEKINLQPIVAFLKIPNLQVGNDEMIYPLTDR